MFKNIPNEIKCLNQWVCTKGDSKIPMRAFDNIPASSVNPRSWSSYEIAEKSVSRGVYDYLGFVFNDNDIVGIDLDDCYDEDGFLTPLACEIISKCHSYTEKSKSGTGIHILVKGKLPFKGKNNLNGIEIYKEARYFIITGDTLLYGDLIANQEAIDYVVEKYFSDVDRESESQSNGSLYNRIYTPMWEKPEHSKIKLRPVYNIIPDGTRNLSLTSLAGQWHTLGYDKEEIYKELLYVNAVACRPPLDNSEVQSIVNSVTRYRRM